MAALLAGSMLTSACFELDVPTIQPTGGQTYTRAEILASPVLLERVVAGTFVLFWAAVREDTPWVLLSAYGEEFSSSATNVSTTFWELAREPRVEIANNLGVEHSHVRIPWHLFYESNSTAADFYGVVTRENIRIIDPDTDQDNTERLLAFARFMMGLSHLYIGLLYDSAAIINEDVDLTVPTTQPVKPYTEVLDSAVRWLEEAAERAENNSFSFPLNEGQWVFNTAFNNQRLVEVANAYIARALVYGARTPEERLNSDWNKVKQVLAKAGRANFGPRGFSASGGSMQYRAIATVAPIDPTSNDNICNGECTGAGLSRVDTRLVGPSDTSGAYQEWLAKVAGDRFDTVHPIVVQTPDQRIQEANGTEPNIVPTYFKYTDIWPLQSVMDTTLRGPYYVSWYWSSSRARNNHTQFPATGGGANEIENQDLGSIQDEMLLGVELDLLLAEAHLNSTPPDPTAAADLINNSRVLNGGLPPVTAAGVPASVPGAPCVPRRYDGSCGTLFDALVYEKRLETYATGISFFDLRGWGCLLEGTAMQFAPPGTQLDIMGRVIYSYGGSGSGPTRGAPRPTNCPLLHHP
jgi:hypothetical protein